MKQVASQKLALSGGPAAVTQAIPTWPVVTEGEVTAMAEVVRSGVWSWLGPNERAFMEEWAEFNGTRHAICMANGTVTLQCALQAVGVVPGDEVIVPGFTWVATAQAALDIGADVVLVDIDPETYCLSPDAVRAAITPRTKAIVPVHLYGCMCDMDELMAIAREHDLKVVEDVAHQHGGRWRDRRAGAIGDVGSFSFQQSKILTSGEGGSVICDDDDLYDCMFALKQVGFRIDSDQPPLANGVPALVPAGRYGHNYRITEMQCVLLRAGLRRLPEQNLRRDRAAIRLATGLEQIGGPLRAAKRDPRVTQQAYYSMTLHYDPQKGGGLTKGQFLRALNAEGVPCNGGYSAVYRSPLLDLYDTTSPVPFRDPGRIQNYRDLRLPNVERATEHTLVALPHPNLVGDDTYLDQLLSGVEKVSGKLDEVRDALGDQKD